MIVIFSPLVLCLGMSLQDRLTGAVLAKCLMTREWQKCSLDTRTTTGLMKELPLTTAARFTRTGVFWS